MTLIELREMCAKVADDFNKFMLSKGHAPSIASEVIAEGIRAIQLPEQEPANPTVNDSLTVAALEKQVATLKEEAEQLQTQVHLLELKNQKLQEKALSAEKWKGIASAKFGDGRTVQQIEIEATEPLLKQVAELRNAIEQIKISALGGLCQFSHKGTRAFHEDINILCDYILSKTEQDDN
jgi:hypothetical protein